MLVLFIFYMTKYSISKKCDKIIDNFYSNNNYLSLNDLLLRKQCKKAFSKMIYQNLKPIVSVKKMNVLFVMTLKIINIK